MIQQRIYARDEIEMAKICAQLAREGIAFEASHDGNIWRIDILGY
jgi:hypothetical protein